MGRLNPLTNRLLAIAEPMGIAPDKILGADLNDLSKLDCRNDYQFGVRSKAWHSIRIESCALAECSLWRKSSILDFQMMGSLAELILRTNHRLLSALRLSYRYVFLDEFQDTTGNRFQLLNTAFMELRPSRSRG